MGREGGGRGIILARERWIHIHGKSCGFGRHGPTALANALVGWWLAGWRPAPTSFYHYDDDERQTDGKTATEPQQLSEL